MSVRPLGPSAPVRPSPAVSPEAPAPVAPAPAPQPVETPAPVDPAVQAHARQQAVTRDGEVRERLAAATADRSAANAVRVEAFLAQAVPAPKPTGVHSKALKPLEAARIEWGHRRQLNDNHPEILTRYSKDHAITSSTLPAAGMAHPGAHQGQVINGDGSIFTSHQNRTGRDLYQDMVLTNPSDHPVTVTVRALASSSTTEAPYRDKAQTPSNANGTRPDPTGKGVNGPGDRTADRILRGHRDGPASITIPPHGTAVLNSAFHGKGQELVSQAEFHTSGPVHAAVLYSAKRLANDSHGNCAAAADILQHSDRVVRSPEHDKVPSAPGQSAFIYGRVAGMVEASDGKIRLANEDGGNRFITDRPGTQEFALLTKTTRKVDGYDSAGTMLSRYPDSAYKNHANYGAELRVELPLHNPAGAEHSRRVRVYFDTPPEKDFGGVSRSIRNGIAATVNGHTSIFNLNQRAGTRSEVPLLDVTLPPGQSVDAQLRMFNAANNTPPHHLRVVTQDL